MTPAQGTVVRHSITVDASQEQAFATFTSGHDRWWPRDSTSAARSSKRR